MKPPQNSIPLRVIIATLVFSFGADRLQAQVPQLIHFQGFVEVNRSHFHGLGEFKFSLVNSNGATTFWSNDGSAADGAEPATTVPVVVNKGVYSVNLGDTQLPDMTPIPPTIFTNSDVRLRVWFNDGKHGFEQLSPDQRITSVGYAMMAANVPNGSITSQKLAPDAVTAANIAAGSIGANQLANGSITADKLAPGTFPPGLIPDGSVTTSKLADQAVTMAKLAPGAVGASQLAPGTALANLSASGQGGVGAGGIVLSFDANSTALANAGYVKVGSLPVGLGGWEARSTSLSPRWRHSAVWTGAEMLIWGGGAAGFFLNDGGRYNPATDSWQPIPTAGAPSGRWVHGAVWTGSQMVIWGGRNNFFSYAGNKNDGARYDPAANSWKPIAQTGAPSARSELPSIWTGSEMLVWGGEGDGGQNWGDGARYNPATDAWTPITTNGAPQGRLDHTAIWNGHEMLVWGGGTLVGTAFGVSFNTGGRYDPSADKWTSITTVGAPPAAGQAVSVWTGNEMVVWGGNDTSRATLNTGGRYDPVLDSWRATTLSGAPTERESHSGIWSGTEMIVFGGARKGPGGVLYDIFNTGGRYDPKTDNWTALSTLNAPSPRIGHTAIWTGQGMQVFGGYANGAGEFNSNYFWTPPSLLYLYQRQ